MSLLECSYDLTLSIIVAMSKIEHCSRRTCGYLWIKFYLFFIRRQLAVKLMVIINAEFLNPHAGKWLWWLPWVNRCIDQSMINYDGMGDRINCFDYLMSWLSWWSFFKMADEESRNIEYNQFNSMILITLRGA